MIPGIYPRHVSTTFNSKVQLHPTSKKTPNGGRIIAKIALMGSVQVRAIFESVFF